jgi:excisionase family DNA binding protein
MKGQAMSSKLLRTMDAAERLGCSTERVRQLEREGRIRAERTPSGQRIFFSDEVEKLAAERQQAKAAGEN